MTKCINEEEMEQLRQALHGEDPVAIWKVMQQLGLSPNDEPYGSYMRYTGVKKYWYRLNLKGPWKVGGGYYDRTDNVSIRRYAYEQKLAVANAALADGSFEQFQLYQNMRTVREWCRIVSTPKQFLVRARGPVKLLLEFFVARPGLRRQIGGRIARYYNPCTTEANTKHKSKSCVMF